MDALCPDEDILGPASLLMADHHSLLLTEIEKTMNTPFGRLMVFMPPGSAKSSYANVALSWDASRPPPPHRQGDARFIMASYNDKIAHKQSGRIQTICASHKYRNMWDKPVELVTDAKGEWSLSNGTEVMAAGLTAGITGNRADGVLIDDPVKNREDAESETVREKTWDEYNDSVMTRLKPGAWVIIIQTRWHELDLSGMLLPEDYKGESGPILCTDGKVWNVINIPAKAERPDDPLGRAPGEYLWAEWFTPEHWAQYERTQTRKGRRTWQALYQQNPTPEGIGDFKREDFNWYNPGEEPPGMYLIGASDYAVTEGGGDFSEHGVWGLDGDNNLWAIDWWSGQKGPEESGAAFIEKLQKYKGRFSMWLNEGGVIDKAMRPLLNRLMREANVFVDLRSLPSMSDKRAKVSAFGARVSASNIWLPRCDWAYDLVDQLIAMPGGRYDDKADVAGLIGRALDKFNELPPPAAGPEQGIIPFTQAWLEYGDDRKPETPRYR